MKIEISDLRNELGGKKEFTFDLKEIGSLEELKILKPIQIRGKIVNAGNSLKLTAQVKTEVLAACTRCLDEVKIPLDFEFEEEYVHESQLGEFPENQEQNLIVYQEPWLDLAQIVKENVILHLPIQILCRPDCPGICPVCGRDLKMGLCNCKENEIDPRLAILAQLKTNREQ